MSSQTSPNRSQSRGRGGVATGFGNVLPSSATSQNSDSATRESTEHLVPRGRAAVRYVPVPGDNERLDENSKGDVHESTLHSTGRGGMANITPLRTPPVEAPHLIDHLGADEELVSTGRGGAGNIRSRSRSEARKRVESHTPSNHNMVSTGRGGAGNIRDRSKSQARTDTPRDAHGDVPDAERHATDHKHTPPDVVDDNTQKHGIDGFVHRLIHHEHK